MGSINILAIDDDVRMLEQYKVMLMGREYVDQVELATDGIEGIKAITEHKPDIVILDIIMPNLDGMSMLKLMRTSLNTIKQPFVIMISAYGFEEIVREAMELGVYKFIKKPANIGAIIHAVDTCYKELQEDKEESNKKDSVTEPESNYKYLAKDVTDFIRDVGIPANVKGYHYLRDAIISSTESKRFQSVTKVLYPEIAKHYDTTPSRVERAIRHAIDIAWSRGNVNTLHDTFGFSIKAERGRPTNAEFIALAADKMHMKYKNKIDNK